MTGWAQIHGLRGELDSIEKLQNRVDYDIDYIDNWSLWLDIKIIFNTMLTSSMILTPIDVAIVGKSISTPKTLVAAQKASTFPRNNVSAKPIPFC